MVKVLELLSFILNEIHHLLIRIFQKMGFDFTDKELHFIIIGIIGIIMFLVVNQAFKALVKLSVEVVSFIYTITVLIVLVFAIEIEQKITGGGMMEFEDIIAGLWGFVYMFSIYILIRAGVYVVKKLVKSLREKKDEKVKESAR
ncbi:hypothetical protein SH2C18_43000 [Clostridium sediminicola]|uniref:hypothetical protein n=1 Tax=Clostridium sediminicola TaxID=3114879 RepID=UPI0031F228C3